jgi:protein-L-isoaspartate(D-aspartate) O-methyltransferase
MNRLGSGPEQGTTMTEGIDYGLHRHVMVEEQIVHRGIRDEDVLAAMRSVPRHLFVPEGMAHQAYQDAPLPIGFGQTISQPYMVALMTSLLKVDVRSRVLEVGAGSGYQTAVLAELAGEVYAIERIASLAERARSVLGRLGYANIHLAVADGSRGWPERAPFDGILVAAAATETPQPLLEQLGEGGRLVLPVGRPHHDQVLTIYERHGSGFVERHDTRCRFVPLVSEGGPEPAGGETAGREEPAELALSGPVAQEVDMKAVDVRVHGTVQGVFFRRTAQSEARSLGLAGWVRNLSDGSVALHLQGDPSVVDQMLGWCRVGPPGAEVSRLDVEDSRPDMSLLGFEVR